MKILKIISIFTYLLIINQVSAMPDYNDIFSDVDPCMVIYDFNKHKIIENMNNQKCAEQISPCSTFKIALSLMGYDSGILKDENNPKWELDKKDAENMKLDIWKQDHTPKTWMANSVVWYSQRLTNMLGMEKFQNYVNKFSYGNKDLSGNPGKNDGLVESWLSSSLKISAYEQIAFLKKLKSGELPVSKQAIEFTKELLFLEELENGWKLYGKTGSGRDKDQESAVEKNLQYGWFVGWLEKDNQVYLFALNIHDTKKVSEAAGLRAQTMAKEIFSVLDFLNK